MSIVGDIMLSRGVQKYLTENGYDYPYENVREIFLQDDFTIGNLECPVTDNRNSVDKTKRFLFRADTENGPALKRAGFDCLNLANNHATDCLSEGLSDTMDILEENGILVSGASRSADSESSCVLEKNGIRIGVLAYSALPPEGFFYLEDRPNIRYISTRSLSRLEEDIASLDCDFTIIYFHWGPEYMPFHSENQEMIAREAIDAGADFVVGTHPHVLQESEIYKGKYIYYSLGNFIFDKQIPPGTDQSIILQLTVKKDGDVKVSEIPAVIRKSQPVLVETQESIENTGNETEQ